MAPFAHSTRVPRYFFHLHNDIDAFDEEGRELSDLAAAREKATLEARAMAAESARAGRLTLSHYVSVTDENGDTVFSTTFGDAVRVTR